MFNKVNLSAARVGLKLTKGDDALFNFLEECTINGDSHALLDRLSATIFTWRSNLERVSYFVVLRIRTKELFFLDADDKEVFSLVGDLLFPNRLLF